MFVYKDIQFSSNELMNIKEKIVYASLQLFNTEGVEKVTTRHIAKSLSISQGNLHYHYPNKDEIIKLLFDNFMNEISQSRLYESNVLFKKESILESMNSNYTIMYQYRFLFVDNEVVWRRLSIIKTETLELFESKRLNIIEIIKFYRQSGIFRKDISEEQILYLSEQFIFTISTWLNAVAYMNHRVDAIDYYSKFTFRQWLPYLSDNEMKEWEKLLV